MIFGIGTDIVSIKRVAHILSNNKKHFIKRILSAYERDLFALKVQNVAYCAKRFAAKEAFAKALGIGIGKIISFQDLTIRNNQQGKPYFVISTKLQAYLSEQNITQAHLSIADEKANAVAFVVLEKSA